jgi:hypothetical protein
MEARAKHLVITCKSVCIIQNHKLSTHCHKNHELVWKNPRVPAFCG